jgi:arginase
MQSIIDVHGYAVGIGANDEGCAQGPEAIYQAAWFSQLQQQHPNIHPHPIIHPVHLLSLTSKYNIIQEASTRLARQTAQAVQQQHQFINFGGDQSASLGTWSGAYLGNQQQPLGLIWIDAHMDSHTPKTSETGNIHGMPLAALMGHGDARLTHILSPQAKIHPQNLCLLGIRSYEAGEADLLEKLGVRVYFISEIMRRGLQPVLVEALQHVLRHTQRFGVAIDMDAIDPHDAPGVGVPEAAGLCGHEFTRCLHNVLRSYQQQLLGVEIVEFNPQHDQYDRTLHLVRDIVKAVL